VAEAATTEDAPADPASRPVQEADELGLDFRATVCDQGALHGTHVQIFACDDPDEAMIIVDDGKVAYANLIEEAVDAREWHELRDSHGARVHVRA